MTALSERLTQLLEPVANALGYEIVLLEFSPHRGSAILRLYIDRLSGEGGIGLEDCEKVSREVAAALDVADPIAQSYRLEVSSPGLDRPLVKAAHFRRFRGAQVRVQTLAPRDGRRRFQGVVIDADETTLVLRTPEGGLRLPLAEIERARLVPDYGAASTSRPEPATNWDGASDR